MSELPLCTLFSQLRLVVTFFPFSTVKTLVGQFAYFTGKELTFAGSGILVMPECRSREVTATGPTACRQPTAY